MLNLNDFKIFKIGIKLKSIVGGETSITEPQTGTTGTGGGHTPTPPPIKKE